LPATLILYFYLLQLPYITISGLRELAIPTGENNSYTLCIFLTSFCNTFLPFPNIILYNIEIAYLNKETLDNNIEHQLKFFKLEFEYQQEAAIAQGTLLLAAAIDNFKTELKDLEANLSNCRLVTNAARFYKATKYNYFLVASVPNCYWIQSYIFKNLLSGLQLLDALQKYQEYRAD
jgi:hypothetical protein